MSGGTDSHGGTLPGWAMTAFKLALVAVVVYVVVKIIYADFNNKPVDFPAFRGLTNSDDESPPRNNPSRGSVSGRDSRVGNLTGKTGCLAKYRLNEVYACTSAKSGKCICTSD